MTGVGATYGDVGAGSIGSMLHCSRWSIKEKKRHIVTTSRNTFEGDAPRLMEAFSVLYFRNIETNLTTRKKILVVNRGADARS